jgi:hypothetical protein
MLRQHQGRLDEAAELFEQARREARQAGDAMDEFLALEHLVVLRQQQKAWAEARSLAVELERLGGKFREGSEAPFARALLALTRQAVGEREAGRALEAALGDLRVADARQRLGYTLTRAARLDLEQGNAERARARAEEARQTLTALGRPTEILLAEVAFARACRALGQESEVRRVLVDLQLTPLPGAAEPARRELDELKSEAPKGNEGLAVPRHREDRG